MIGKYSQVVLTTLSWLMAAKMEWPILHIKGWFNGQIEITFSRSYSWMLRRAWVTSPLRTLDPELESGLELGLEQ